MCLDFTLAKETPEVVDRETRTDELAFYNLPNWEAFLV